jgi:hypothetical protein
MYLKILVVNIVYYFLEISIQGSSFENCGYIELFTLKYHSVLPGISYILLLTIQIK